MEVCLASSVRVRRSGERGRAPARPGEHEGTGQGWVLMSPVALLQAMHQILKAFWGRRGRRYSLEALPDCRNVAVGG